MPVLIGRREFLAGAAAFSITIASASPVSARWGFLSDTHIAEDPEDSFRGFRPGENLKLAVKQALSMGADGYLVNGDLARFAGLPGDYRRFAELTAPLAERGPLALTLGNHDARETAIPAFTQLAGTRQAIPDKWVSIVESGPVRMLLLDSLYETNKTPGLLGKAQRDWLKNYLTGHADRPTIIFVHHTLNDSDSALLDADRFLEIVIAQPHVKAVLYGHSHAYRYEVKSGVHLVNIPAVGYNFAFNEPVGWVEALLGANGAQLTLHAYAGNRNFDGDTRKLVWRA